MSQLLASPGKGSLSSRVQRPFFFSRTSAFRAGQIVEKVDGAGRHIRQVELCPQHCQIVIERERARGLETRSSHPAMICAQR